MLKPPKLANLGGKTVTGPLFQSPTQLMTMGEGGNKDKLVESLEFCLNGMQQEVNCYFYKKGIKKLYNAALISGA